MAKFEKIHKEVLAQYPRAIVHMRSQKSRKRLGLVFGAGLSSSFNLPSWEILVQNIAADNEVKGTDLLKEKSPSDSLTYKTEMMYQRFKKRKLHDAGEINGSRNLRAMEFEIAGQWLEIVRKHLYGSASPDLKAQIEDHPYFKKLLPLIKKSQMTVTYNFDDYIERALFELRDENEQPDSKGYEVVTSPWTQFRRDNSVIYHPNGIVPHKNLEGPSDRIIFSESSFADQILGQLSGEDTALLNHLSKNTCLFIGLSLKDETLRALLSKSAKKNPGGFHYYVDYLDDDGKSSEHQDAIQHTNFQVYNLITLFLKTHEIAALSDLINSHETEFTDFAAQCGVKTEYRFYLTGPLGVGKSTTINHVRNLSTYDEWLEPRIDILAKPWDELSPEEEIEADNWIIKQFELKNNQLRHSKEGIFVIDRGPMDPIAFTPDEEVSDKANKLIKAYSPGKSNFKVMPGTLLFLTGDTQELQIRLKVSNRDGYTASKLDKMTEKLLNIYGKDNVREFDTTGLSVEQMVKNISEIIHLEKYKDMDMQAQLQNLANPAK